MAVYKKKEKEKPVNWVLTDIKAGELKNVYLLYGEEKYWKRQYYKRLLQAAGDTGDGMNTVIMEGRKLTEEEIILSADTLPFFAERRIVVVKDSGFFKKKADTLAEYMEKVPETTLLIFLEEDVDRSLKLYKRVDKFGRAVAYNALEGQELSVRVAKYLKDSGRNIRQSDMDYLLEQTGNDFTSIINELEKLISYTEGSSEVRREDIDAVVTDHTERAMYELTNAMADKDPARAMNCYYELMKNNKDISMGVIRSAAGLFTQLLELREMRGKGMSSDEIAGKLHLHPYRAKMLCQQAMRYESRELKEMLEECVAAESDIKQGRMDSTIRGELLIARCAGR